MDNCYKNRVLYRCQLLSHGRSPSQLLHKFLKYKTNIITLVQINRKKKKPALRHLHLQLSESEQ